MRKKRESESEGMPERATSGAALQPLERRYHTQSSTKGAILSHTHIYLPGSRLPNFRSGADGARYGKRGVGDGGPGGEGAEYSANVEIQS